MKKTARAVAILVGIIYPGTLTAEVPLSEAFAKPWPLNEQDARPIHRGLSLLEASRYNEAVPLLKEAHDIQRGLPGAELQAAYTALFIATALLELQNPTEAEPYLRSSLDVVHRRLGRKSAASALVLKALGDLYGMRDQYDEAESAYTQALTILEQTGVQLDIRPALMLSLAQVLMSKGEDRRAKTIARRCLRQHNEAGGKAGVEVGYTYELLAVLEYRGGNFDRALALGRDGLRILEDQLGSDHIQVGNILFQIGRTYARKKDFAAAHPMLSRGLQIRERFLGVEHPLTQELRAEYNAIVRKAGREPGSTDGISTFRR